MEENLNENYKEEVEELEEIETTDDEIETEDTGSGIGTLAVVGLVGFGVGALIAKTAKPAIGWVKKKVAEHKAKKESKNDVTEASGDEEFIDSEEVEKTDEN